MSKPSVCVFTQLQNKFLFPTSYLPATNTFLSLRAVFALCLERESGWLRFGHHKLHCLLSVMSKLSIRAVGWVMGREGQGLFECNLPKTWWFLLKLINLSAVFPLHALQKCKINSKGQMSEFCPLVSKSQQIPTTAEKTQLGFLLFEVSHPELPACFSPNWTFTCNFNFLWKSLTKQ